MIKAGIDYRVGNRRVSQKQFLKNIETQVVDEARKSILRDVKSVIDPETGRPPKVHFKAGSQLEFEVEGSEAAIDLVRKKLRKGQR